MVDSFSIRPVRDRTKVKDKGGQWPCVCPSRLIPFSPSPQPVLWDGEWGGSEEGSEPCWVGLDWSPQWAGVAGRLDASGCRMDEILGCRMLLAQLQDEVVWSGESLTRFLGRPFSAPWAWRRGRVSQRHHPGLSALSADSRPFVPST